ncbi:hypothetical protein [Pseudaminobacter sp. NGMCC 1.201702]|uniref:hypothetical protein n=1 Tax=Pseudaminobacter sp. NGMCC 1.201702 TaxID=3391825 RepID=UPI0039EE1639
MDIRLLNYVFGFGIVIQHGASDSVEPLIVSLDDEPEGSSFVLPRLFKQGRVVEILDSHRLGWFDRRHHGLFSLRYACASRASLM